MNIEEILEKYESSTIRNIDKENMVKIINFLESQQCNFIEDIIEDYLDLFTFKYEDFVKKYNSLNIKYNNKFLEEASFDMNKLEEFYY